MAILQLYMVNFHKAIAIDIQEIWLKAIQSQTLVSGNI